MELTKGHWKLIENKEHNMLEVVSYVPTDDKALAFERPVAAIAPGPEALANGAVIAGSKRLLTALNACVKLMEEKNYKSHADLRVYNLAKSALKEATEVSITKHDE